MTSPHNCPHCHCLPDDDVFADREWIDKCGMTSPDSRSYWRRSYADGDYNDSPHGVVDDGWVTLSLGGALIANRATRGQIRRLCRLVGLPIDE